MWKEANAKALLFFQQAVKTDPEYSDAWRELADAYDALQRYEEAIASYKEAVRLDPRDWVAYYNMANTYEELKEFKAAIEALRQVLLLAPPDFFVFSSENKLEHPAIRIGNYYLNMKQYGDALAAYQEAVRLMPDSYEAYGHIASVYLVDDAPRAAIEACKQSLRIKPDYDIAHSILGMAYVDSGNKVLALEEYKILKTLNAEFAQVLFQYIYPR